MGNKPTPPLPTVNKPPPSQPTVNERAAKAPTGDKPTAKAPTGDKPAGKKPAGKKPTAAASSSSTATTTGKGFGRLSLSSEPWSDVSIDGNPLGQQTPVLGVRLPAGRHVVRLSNPHYKIERTIVVEITASEETRRFVDLTAR
jgi:serine/threonine-protein kinase